MKEQKRSSREENRSLVNHTEDQMRHYEPEHVVTGNYRMGLEAIKNSDLPGAIALLSSEPTDSACYGLALANKALAELRLGSFTVSESTGRQALAEFKSHGCPHPPTWIQTFRNLGESVSLQDHRWSSMFFMQLSYQCFSGEQESGD